MKSICNHSFQVHIPSIEQKKSLSALFLLQSLLVLQVLLLVLVLHFTKVHLNLQKYQAVCLIWNKRIKGLPAASDLYCPVYLTDLMTNCDI